MRKSQHKVAPINVSSCPQCGEAKLHHRACPSCGTYKDRTVIETEA
ncbi:ribosomal protein L32 [Desulfosudis oleivorans Hxd3]|uniref:Large ribosomal subunit protein bL32 n=2 Tax=Desulfosudis TaxID=2904716 RepID=A8ZTV6_DESOH|nr:ribosomal protein L32 [Desulfosudis oleivorans Hxd3]